MAVTVIVAVLASNELVQRKALMEIVLLPVASAAGAMVKTRVFPFPLPMALTEFVPIKAW